MLMTVKEYCTIEGVSRQFVYKYIKLGKFQLVELPIYAEEGGNRFYMGTEKFLKVPEGFQPPDLDKAQVQLTVFRATKDSDIRKKLEHLFLLEDEDEAEAFRKKLFSEYDQPKHPKRTIFLDAIKQIEHNFKKELYALDNSVKRLENDVKLLQKEALVYQ